MQNTIVGTHLEGAKVWLQKCFRLSHHPQKIHNRIYEITQRPIEYDVMRDITSTKCWGSTKKEITNSALGDRRELQWGSHIWAEYYRISGDFPGRKGREYFPEKGNCTYLFQESEWLCYKILTEAGPWGARGVEESNERQIRQGWLRTGKIVEGPVC